MPPLSGGLACYGVYQCADGKYIALGILEAKFWKIFCEMAGHPDWIEKHLVMGEEAENLRKEIAAFFHTRTRDEWVAEARNLDVCLSPVLDLSEVETDPQIQARHMIHEQKHPVCGKVKGIGIPLKFSATPSEPAWPSPALGEDTKSIMEEIGYPQEEIAALSKAGIILISD